MPGKTLIRTPRGARSVGLVTMVDPAQSCFLTEWYQPVLADGGVDDVVSRLDEAAACYRSQGHRIALLVAVSAPIDEVLFGVFTADSADTVTAVCRRAGWPVDRIVSGVQTRIA